MIIIFYQVLLDIDKYFKLKDKKILLLIDNVPSHFDLNYRLSDDDEIEEGRRAESLYLSFNCFTVFQEKELASA